MSRNTDPDRPTVAAVRLRDGGCVVCGTHWSPTTQHRIARGMGGTRDAAINRPSNLITLCGSGTTGHHGWVEHHPAFAREAGWALSRTDDPLTVPVLYPDGWFLLDDTGNRIPDDTLREPRARGHRGSSSRGWGELEHDQDVGGPWPAGTPWPAGEADPVRPWGGPRAGGAETACDVSESTVAGYNPQG